MPSTYTLISSNVLTSSAASVNFFSIPATYTDLVLRATMRGSGNLSGNITSSVLYLNGSTSGSFTFLSGGGTSLFSGRDIGYMNSLTMPDAYHTSDTFSNGEMYFPNYLSTTQKPILVKNVTENNAASYAEIRAAALLSSLTSAITAINLTSANGNYVAGSSFYLYGIKNS
jgi:hypothetical protein